MSTNIEFVVNTGDPVADQQTAATYQQQYQAQGMTVQIAPNPAGGFIVRAFPGQGAAPAAAAPPAGAAPAAAAPAAAPQKGPGLLSDWRVAQGAAAVAGIVAGAITFVLSGMGIAVMAGVGAGLGLVFGILLLVVGKPKLLHGVGAISVATIVGALGSGGMFFITHPSLHVDNPSKDAIKVYVDGKMVLEVAAGDDDSVMVHRGEHEFGWSPDDADEAEETVTAEMSMMKAHLYNPGKTGCYWLVVDRYGNKSTAGHAFGPQPLEEFYKFDKVDNWFTDNPNSVKVNKKQSGAVKTALRRNPMCMQFNHCSVKVRERLIECQSENLDDDDGHQACGAAADAACGNDDDASHGNTSSASSKKKKKKSDKKKKK